MAGGNANASCCASARPAAGKAVDASAAQTFQLIRRRVRPADSAGRLHQGGRSLCKKSLPQLSSLPGSIQSWLHAGDTHFGAALGQADGDLAAGGQLGGAVQHATLVVADDGIAAFQGALRVQQFELGVQGGQRLALRTLLRA